MQPAVTISRAGKLAHMGIVTLQIQRENPLGTCVCSTKGLDQTSADLPVYICSETMLVFRCGTQSCFRVIFMSENYPFLSRLEPEPQCLLGSFLMV